MKAGGERGRRPETRDVALQTEVPVQNAMTKMDILIVTQRCHIGTTAGQGTLGEEGERRSENKVFAVRSAISLRNMCVKSEVSNFECVNKRVQKRCGDVRISQAAACACVVNKVTNKLKRKG